MRNLLAHFSADETGATSIEYALIALFIGTAIITTLTTIGIELRAPFVAVSSGLQTTGGN